MTTTKWKDIAEIVALFAVVASLIAVVVELRQTQAALQAQAYQTRASEAFLTHLEFAQHPELDILFKRSLAEDFDPASLTEAELAQLERMYFAIRTDVDNEFYQYQRGYLDPEFYERATVADIQEFAPRWRRLGIGELREEFRIEVERVLADPTVTQVDNIMQPDRGTE